jgi:hypothetical protein
MSDFGDGKYIKTRTKHRCDWCFEPILIGESAYFYTGRYDDEWQNWYMHPECYDAFMKDAYTDDYTFSPGEGTRPRSYLAVPPIVEVVPVTPVRTPLKD